MANKKVKPTEDYYDFLPTEVQNSTKLDISEKNVLSTLCFHRLNYSIYAEEHDGWFYTSQKDIEEGAELSHMQTNRILLKLTLKKLIERQSGTNHRCTHYRLHPKIVELLPITEHANDTLAVVDDAKTSNDTLVVNSTKSEANDTLDKIRLDESSKDEYSLISEENVVSETASNAVPQQQNENDWDVMLKQFKLETDKAKTIEQLETTKKLFIENARRNPMPPSCREAFEATRDHYDWRYAVLRNTH